MNISQKLESVISAHAASLEEYAYLSERLDRTGDVQEWNYLKERIDALIKALDAYDDEIQSLEEMLEDEALDDQIDWEEIEAKAELDHEDFIFRSGF